MTTLYRSPTVLIGDHEWHLAVVRKAGRILRRYRWRPAANRAHPWRSIETWPTRKPKLWLDFKPYQGHAAKAERYERERADAAFRAVK